MLCYHTRLWNKVVYITKQGNRFCKNETISWRSTKRLGDSCRWAFRADRHTWSCPVVRSWRLLRVSLTVHSSHGVVQSSVVGVYYVYHWLSTAHVHFTAFTRVLLVRLSIFRTTWQQTTWLMWARTEENPWSSHLRHGLRISQNSITSVCCGFVAQPSARAAHLY